MTSVKKKMLVTGCNGFIGQNFLRNVDLSRYSVLNLDCLSYASDRTSHLNFPQIKFIKINLTNYTKLQDIFSSFKPDRGCKFCGTFSCRQVHF